MYTILSCLEKYGFSNFDDFCTTYGYDKDSINALKLYKSTCREYKNVVKLFGDIMEELQGII